MTLESIATEYAARTGCDVATAMQAAFVAATLLADLAGRRDLGDYFSARASEMTGRQTGEPMIHYQEAPVIGRGALIPANDAMVKMYQAGGVWHWE